MVIFMTVTALILAPTYAKLADRGRVVDVRQERSDAVNKMNSRVYGMRTKPIVTELPIEGPKYRGKDRWEATRSNDQRTNEKHLRSSQNHKIDQTLTQGEIVGTNHAKVENIDELNEHDEFGRKLSSQLTGCCDTYSSYSTATLCGLYGEDCNSGQEPSHDSGDEDCTMEGLSFIGVSFSVNTAYGNPYSYQLCDQFMMEGIIDRDYEYVMSMDEDGWLVGGGYKSFDYSGKMPYIDSSHTELLRIGGLDPDYGGTTISQVSGALTSLYFPPFAIFPEYVKGGGGGGSGSDDDSSVPSRDVTLIVSIVEEYGDDDNYGYYEMFLDNLFNAMDAVNGGPCMDDHDTDPHVSMARGVKFKSSYHESQYFFKANLEVAVWQSIYPNGVVIGSSGTASFPPENAHKNQATVGYGNLYFFFDRANITASYPPYRALTSSENYYSTLMEEYSSIYTNKKSSLTQVNFDYAGSGSGDDQYYEHNAYSWNAAMAKHDMTDGWDLPPYCEQEGETFLGIPLSRASGSKLITTSSFQDQFDFEYLIDRNFTYIQSFGTNHGWLVGEVIGNAAGSIVDPDTAHIPIFYTGTTNADMGGMSLSNMIKITKTIEFGTLYIKPAFVFQDDDGSVKLQFEADSSSALAYLYDNLCKMIGLTWNYDTPYNELDVYSSCVMHAAGDRAVYGCGPDNGNTGGFCPQMTLAYRVAFQSEDAAAEFLEKSNVYIDYWRSQYPSGVAVGTSNFCPDGGCLGLFLNRYDLYQVFKPDNAGSWVEYNGGTFAPTISPAPTHSGGCDDPHNRHLDICFRKRNKPKAAVAVWNSLGAVGQFSLFLVSFMAVTLSASIFLSRAKRRRKKGETYLAFFVRDLNRNSQSKKKLRKRKKKIRPLEEKMLDNDATTSSRKSRSSSRPKAGKSKEKSKTQSRARSKSRDPTKQKEDDRSRDKSRSTLSKKKSDSGKSTTSRSKSRGRGRDKSKSKKERDRSSSRSRRKNIEKDERRQLV